MIFDCKISYRRINSHLWALKFLNKISSGMKFSCYQIRVYVSHWISIIQKNVNMYKNLDLSIALSPYPNQSKNLKFWKLFSPSIWSICSVFSCFLKKQFSKACLRLRKIILKRRTGGRGREGPTKSTRCPFSQNFKNFDFGRHGASPRTFFKINFGFNLFIIL